MINISRNTNNNSDTTNNSNTIAVNIKRPSGDSMIGNKFGDYVVVNDSDRDGSGHKLLLCVCPVCGDSFKTTSYELLKGRKNTTCKNCEASRYESNTSTSTNGNIILRPYTPSDSSTTLVGEYNKEVVVGTASDNDTMPSYITHVIPLSDGYREEEYEVCCEEKVFVRDLEKDLLEMPVYYHIAHCIPADITFYGVTARRINEIYDMGEQLTNDGRDSSIGYSVGEAVLIDNVFNLIATEKKHKRPIMDDLYECVLEMASICASCGIKYLAMPRLGCGHNKLNWEDVKEMIISVFSEVYEENEECKPIYITFCFQ